MERSAIAYRRQPRGALASAQEGRARRKKAKPSYPRPPPRLPVSAADPSWPFIVLASSHVHSRSGTGRIGCLDGPSGCSRACGWRGEDAERGEGGRKRLFSRIFRAGHFGVGLWGAHMFIGALRDSLDAGPVASRWSGVALHAARESARGEPAWMEASGSVRMLREPFRRLPANHSPGVDSFLSPVTYRLCGPLPAVTSSLVTRCSRHVNP